MPVEMWSASSAADMVAAAQLGRLWKICFFIIGLVIVFGLVGEVKTGLGMANVDDKCEKFP